MCGKEWQIADRRLSRKKKSKECLRLEERKRARQSVVLYIQKASSFPSSDAIIANSGFAWRLRV